MKVRVYHKDGVAFTVYRVLEIIDEKEVIVVTYNMGNGMEADYSFRVEEIEKIEIEV